MFSCEPRLQIAVAENDELDCWTATVSMPRQELLGHLPYSLQQEQMSSGDGGPQSSSGMFWNYFSVRDLTREIENVLLESVL